MQHGYFLPAHHGFPSCSAQTYGQVLYQNHINHFNMNSLPGLGDSTSGSSLAASERWKSFGRYGTGNRAITNVPSSHPNIPAMLHGQGQQFPTSRSLVNDMLNPSMLHPAKYYGDPRAGSQLPQQLLQSLTQFSQQRFSKQGWVCEVPSASQAQKKSTSRYQPPGSVPQSWSSIYNGALGYGSGLFPHSLHDSLPAQHLSYNERAAQLYSKRMSAETFTGAKHHDNPNQQSGDSMQFPLSVEYDHARLQSSLPRATPLPSNESVTELYHNRVTAETLNDARQQNSNTNKAAGSIPYSISEEYDHRQAQPLVLPSGQCQQNGHEVFSVEYQQKSMERPGHPCDQTFNETSSSQEASSGSVLGNRFYSKVASKAKKAKSKYSSRLPKKQQRKSRCDLGSGISQDQGRRSEYCFQASQTVYPVKHSSMVNGAQNTGVGSTSTNKRKSEDFLVHMLRKLCSSAENSSTNSRSLFGSTLYSSSDELSQTSHVYRLAEESQEGRTNRSGNSHCGVDGSQWAQTGRGASGEKCHPAMNTEDRTMLQNVGPLLQELLVKNKPRLYERLYLTVKSSPVLQTLIDKESSRSRKHLYPKIKRLLDILNKLNNRLASDNTNISSQTQPSSMNNSTDERLVPTGTRSLQKCQSARCPIICDLHNPLRFPVHHEEDTLSASDPSLTPVQQKQSENCGSDKSDDELVRDVDIMKRTYESSGAQELDSQQINLREKLPEVSGLDHVNPHSALKHSVSDIQLAETALKHSESDTQLTTDHTSVVLPFDKYLHTIKTSAGLGGGSSPASLGKKSLDICHTCLACERTFSSSSRLEEHFFARLQSNTSNSVSVDRKRDLFQDDGMDSEHPVHLKPEPTEQATSFPIGNEQVAVTNETTGNCVKFDAIKKSVCRLYDPESEENGQELNVQNEGKQTFQVDVSCQQDTVSAKQVLVSPVSKREETPIEPRPAFDSRKLLTEKTKGEHDCFVISEHFVDIENHVFPSSPQNFQESQTSEFSHSKVSAPKMTGTSKTKTGLTKGKLKSSGSPNSHLKLYGQTTIQETCQSSYTKKIGESAHCPDKTLVSKTPLLDTLKTAADGTMRIEPARKEKSVEKQRAEGQCSFPVKCAVEDIRSADRENSSPADTQELRWEIAETAGSDILPFSAKKSCLKKRKSNIISDRNDHSMKKLNRPYKPVSAVHKNRNTVAASVSGEKRKFSSSKQQLDTKDNSKMRSVEIFKDRHVVFPIKHITQANSTRGSPRTNRTLNPKKRKVEHIYESKAQCGHEVMDMDYIPSKKSKVDGEDKCVHVDDLEERKRDVKCSDAFNSSRKKNCCRSSNLCGIKVQNSISASSKSDDPKTDHKIDSNRRVATSSKAKKIVNSLKNLFKNNLHLQSHCMRQGKAGAKDATCVKDWIQECRHKTLREILETQHVGNESRNETRWLKDNAESSMSDTAPSWKKNTNTNDPENTIGICEHKGCTNESVNSSLEPVADSVQVCSDHRLKDSVSSVSDDKSCSRSVNDNSLSSLPGDRSSAQGVNSVNCLSSSKSLSQGVKDNSVNSLSGDRSSNQNMDNSVNRVPGKKSSNENKNDNKDFVFCIKCMTMFTKRLVYNEHGCCQKNQNAKESNEEEMDNVESEQDCTDFGKATLDHEHKYDTAKINPSICIELDNDSGLSDTVCASDAEYNQKQKSTHYKLKRLPKVGKEKNRKRMTSSQKKKPMRLSSKIDKTNASAHALFKCEHCDQNYSSRGGLLFHWQAVHRKSIA